MNLGKIIHLEPNKLNRNRNTLILLVPSIIFALILAILLYTQKDTIKEQVAQISTETYILGEETELDIK